MSSAVQKLCGLYSFKHRFHVIATDLKVEGGKSDQNQSSLERDSMGRVPVSKMEIQLFLSLTLEVTRCLTEAGRGFLLCLAGLFFLPEEKMNEIL